jgi:hypothetical protein
MARLTEDDLTPAPDDSWVCVCGAIHKITPGQPIHCHGIGHSVYLSPEYFQYRAEKKAKIEKSERIVMSKANVNKEGQVNLF